MNLSPLSLDKQIRQWFTEDIGNGDHSTLSCIPANAQGTSQLIVKADGVIAGIEVAKRVFAIFDNTLRMEPLLHDGDHVRSGDIAFRVHGSIRSLLQTERLMLNIMQRMSGIATRTAQYVERLKGTHTRVLDTRKTTPGLRLLEKEAVRIGGGTNHRFGLFDMIMLKDNHIDFAGGIEQAIERARAYCTTKNLPLKIEIEIRNLDELKCVLTHGGVDRVMLDNFDVPTTRRAVQLISGTIETESSGGITLDTLRAYAECGVDYISVGALTHSIKSLDMSFKAVK